jgi:UDP-glucose 4-epimerase
MIMVTGGNGYVGQALCQRLTALGREVASVSRKEYDTKDYVSLVGDVGDKDSLAAIFEAHPIETVVHLASMLNTASRQHPDWAVRVNVMGSLNLMELCRDHGVKRFIFGSSFNAIGGRPGSDRAFDETEPSQPDEFYGETKRFVEKLGISLAELGAFEFASARMSIIVGPGEPSPTSAWRTDMFNLLPTGGAITITFAADEVIPLTHYEEIADSIAALVEAERLGHRVYHLPNESWRVVDLARELEAIGRDLHVSCGDRALDGIPARVSWSRLRDEFDFSATPLRERLITYRERAEHVR